MSVFKNTYACRIIAEIERLGKQSAKRLFFLKEIIAGRDQLLLERNEFRLQVKELSAQLDKFSTWVPPGHFYSPIPSLTEVKTREAQIFHSDVREIAGVDLNEAEQLQLLDEFSEYYKDLPFESGEKRGLRYRFENPNFSYSDAICYYAMIRHAKPQRIIEVGAGYSSCVALDVNELFFNNTIECIFIEPYPELLLSLINQRDRQQVKIIQKQLQDVEPSLFSSLMEGDILFIDSTHVSKIASDVNYIFFHVLPNLSPGTYIHFHDIFYPFEYPKEWIYEGRSWNESYMLRAFLLHNNAFKIVFFSGYLQHVHSDRFFGGMPLCRINPGAHIWLRKGN